MTSLGGVNVAAGDSLTGYASGHFGLDSSSGTLDVSGDASGVVGGSATAQIGGDGSLSASGRGSLVFGDGVSVTSGSTVSASAVEGMDIVSRTVDVIGSGGVRVAGSESVCWISCLGSL